MRLKDCLLAGPEHPQTLTSANNLAAALSAQGKHKQAEEIIKEVRWNLPEHRPSWHGLASQRIRTLRLASGSLQVSETMRRVLGSEHPDTLMVQNNLASSLLQQGKTLKAEAMQREVLAVQKRVRPYLHMERGSIMPHGITAPGAAH
jgi:predicted Zn-dependent protease